MGIESLQNTLRQEFRKAEESISNAEFYADLLGATSAENEDCFHENHPKGIAIPSVNELRYAASHLINVFCEPNIQSDGSAEQIHRAIRHCVRARKDALRASFLHFVRHFAAFTQEYSHIRPSLSEQDIAGWESYRNKLIGWQERLNQKKSFPDIQSEVGYLEHQCDNLETFLGEMREFYLSVEKHRSYYDELLLQNNYMQEQIKQHDIKSTKQYLMGIAVSLGIFILGLVVGQLLNYR